MKVQNFDGVDAQVATAMIVSSPVLERASALWRKGGMFMAQPLNAIGQLCVDYFLRFGKAPGPNVEGLVRNWCEKRPGDRESAEYMERLLGSLSGAWEQRRDGINPTFEIERMQRAFEENNKRRLAGKLEDAIGAGDFDRADELLNGYRRVEAGVDEGVFLDDPSIWESALTGREDASLVRYPGPLGEFFGDSLERDALIAFLAPEKRGKCVPENTLIQLADGRIRTIRSLVESHDKMPIMALDCESQRLVSVEVSEFWDNGIKECWEITTKTGRKIATTSNHKYLTPDGWKLLIDLEAGDFIAVAKRMGVFGSNALPVHEIKFLAYMLADGGCTSSSATFTKADPILVNDFKNCCCKLGIGCTTNGIQHRLTNCGILRRKYACALWKVSSKTKKIPPAIFTCPQDQVRTFLRVFFSCDGSVNKAGTVVELTLANKAMLRQIGHLLTRFGIVYSFAFRWATCNGKRFKAWRISIRSQEYVNQFLREINFLSHKYRELTDGMPSKSFLDKFPWQVASKFYQELEAEYKGATVPPTRSGKGFRPRNAFKASFGVRKAAMIREQIAKKLPIMRRSFANADLALSTTQKYMGSDILWDEVVSIRSVGKKHTYDLTIPRHHNFVANDCIVHNSFFLIDLAWRAMLQRRKVAFFGAGDMTRDQYMRRIAARAAGRPVRPGIIRIPKDLSMSEARKRSAEVVDFEERSFKAGLPWREAHEAYVNRVLKERVKSKGNLFFISCHDNATLTVQRIGTILDGKIREGWQADCIVIDYADILAPPTGRLDYRDGINETWKQLRALSSSRRCLVATATQANRQSYDAEVILMRHMGEDKRKLAHATGVVGINLTAREKEQGIRRLNWVALRERDFNPYRVVHVAGCLDIANPAIRSLYPRRDEKATEAEGEDGK